MDHAGRLKAVQSATGISDEQVSQLQEMKGIPFDLADRLVENVVSTISIPIGMTLVFARNSAAWCEPNLTYTQSCNHPDNYKIKEYLMFIRPINNNDVYFIGIATNMIVDGQERLITMATEESSVVAAVCNTAKQCRESGGFVCSTSGPNMIAQVCGSTCIVLPIL